MIPELTSTMRPDDLDDFRQARLLLLARSLASPGVAAPDLERLSFYDFFSANPFLVPAEPSARVSLAFAGFEAANLSYQSSGQRFANNRARLQYDLAILVARGLVMPTVLGRRVTYSVSDAGASLADAMNSMYAEAFRESSKIIVEKLRRMSDTALRTSAKDWLRAENLLIDLYGPDAVMP